MAPFRAAMTGLEILLSRAQLWETTAAKHVSLASELQKCAALATRWRQLELASWESLLSFTAARLAAGVPFCPFSVLASAWC